MYTCMYICMHVYMYIHIHIYIYVYIHIYTSGSGRRTWGGRSPRNQGGVGNISESTAWHWNAGTALTARAVWDTTSFIRICTWIYTYIHTRDLTNSSMYETWLIQSATVTLWNAGKTLTARAVWDMNHSYTYMHGCIHTFTPETWPIHPCTRHDSFKVQHGIVKCRLSAYS